MEQHTTAAVSILFVRSAYHSRISFLFVRSTGLSQRRNSPICVVLPFYVKVHIWASSYHFVPVSIAVQYQSHAQNNVGH